MKCWTTLHSFGIMNVTNYPRIEINEDNLSYNINHFRSKLKDSTRMLVLLKANAYGMGAVEVAHAVEKMGVDYIGVAFVNEGVELRRAGIGLPILVLNWSREALEDIVGYNLEPGMTDIFSLRLFGGYVALRGLKDYPVHIKVDSGMHRVGFMENELDEFREFFDNDNALRVKSIYSHLAGADEACFDGFTLSQAETFDMLSGKISKILGYNPTRHLYNTAGIERFAEKYPKYQYDMVRLGIGLYGFKTLENEDVRPVASLKTKVVQVKHLDECDGTVGYSRKGRISGPTVTATISLGYADGIDRRFGNGGAHFEVNGKLVPTIGNICMDACMINVTGVDVHVGDVVTIFGDSPRMEELSDTLGTIPYELMTRMSRRINRVVVK